MFAKSAVRFVAMLVMAVLFASSPATADQSVDFELHDVDGKVHRLSDYRGQWVIVNFWATWCGPCVREIPILSEISRSSDPVETKVIGIDFEEIDDASLRFAIKKLSIDYLVLRIGSAPLVPFEPLKGLPSTFIVSPEGKIVFRHAGEINKQTLKDALQNAAA